MRYVERLVLSLVLGVVCYLAGFLLYTVLDFPNRVGIMFVMGCVYSGLAQLIPEGK